MPVEIEPLLSDPDLQVWYEDQKWWYIVLLFRAWQNVDNPCHLPNDRDRLRTLAGVPMCRSRQWKERCGAVLAKFQVSSDGRWITNKKQLEVYANQLAKLDARRDAGAKGGLAKASKARSLLHVCYSSTSNSSSASGSVSQEERIDASDLEVLGIDTEKVKAKLLPKDHESKASFAAGYVLDSLDWTGKNARWCYEAQILKQLKRLDGRTAEQIAEEMVESWRLYRVASQNFSIKYGIANFFEKGIWCDRSQWRDADDSKLSRKTQESLASLEQFNQAEKVRNSRMGDSDPAGDGSGPIIAGSPETVC